MLRAIYGFIDSVLLWHKPFSTKLEGMGFEINLYDRCVANKTIEGTQFTIAWYVDDNNFSFKNPEVISNITKEIKKHFGYLSSVRGKKHTFLRMNIEL